MICEWTHPGADPYRGTPSAWIAQAPIPSAAKLELLAMIATNSYTDVVYISRNAIVSANPSIREYRYGSELQAMAFGAGRVCGQPSRVGWDAGHIESGMVFCASDNSCVVRPSICNNWSIIFREPETPPALVWMPVPEVPAESPPVIPSEVPVGADEPRPIGFGWPGPSGFGWPGGGGGGYGAPPVYTAPPSQVSTIPEPSSWALMLGGLAILFRRRT